MNSVAATAQSCRRLAVVAAEGDSGIVVVGGGRRERGADGSMLVFEPRVAEPVDERHVRFEAREIESWRCVPGSLRACRGTFSSSGATTPTMIRKWNIAPVDPERR